MVSLSRRSAALTYPVRRRVWLGISKVSSKDEIFQKLGEKKKS